MYELSKRAVLRLFRAPSGPPEAPSGEHAELRIVRASPSFLRYRMLSVYFTAGLIALVVIASGVIGFFAPPVWIVTALAVLLFVPTILLSYFSTRVDYDLRYYVLTDRSVRVREGAWNVQEKTITFANVQNVRVEQGPLERLFGFSNVRIDTAGGGVVQAGKHAVAMPHGVTLAGLEDAGAIRDAILAKVRVRADAGVGDHDERDTHGVGWTAPRLNALRELATAARVLREAAALSRGGGAQAVE